MSKKEGHKSTKKEKKKHKTHTIEEEYHETATVHSTTPYMTIYEYSSFITARALQLSSGVMPLVPVTSCDPVVVATEEIQAQLPSLVVRRHLPNGSTDSWHLKDMILPRM